MKSVILASLFFLMFQSNANATTTLWQAVGVLQYQQNGQLMKAQTFDVGNFQSLSACNSAISTHNNLLIPGSVTPGNSQNSKSGVDAICHAVITPQLPGYFVIGLAQVQKGSDQSQPLQVNIGPFGTLSLCNSALNAQKTLTLHNTPLTDQNVSYKLDGACHKLMD